MQPVFLNFINMICLKYGLFNYFNKNNIFNLKKAGIICENEELDNRAFLNVKNTINNNIKNKITLMYLIPNNNCNLMCKYCFIGKLNNKNPQKMSEETMKIAVDKFATHLNSISKRSGEIVFYGGEPLINFELIKKCVNYCKANKYNFKFSIVSNATLLNDKMMNFIKENKIGLGISIDGPKEINDKNRIFYKRNISVYDETTKKIRILQKNNIEFGLSVTISEDFLKHQKKFITWLEKLNVKTISYNLLHYTNKTNNWKKYYKNATKFLIKSNNTLYEKGFREDRIKRKYYAFYERDFKYSDCGARGGNQISIKPNGDITICHGYWNSEENKIGNIKYVDFNDIFKTVKYKQWYLNTTINKNECQNCCALYICGGGCAMQSKSLFKNEQSIDKAFCIHSKYILKHLLTEMYYESLTK